MQENDKKFSEILKSRKKLIPLQEGMKERKTYSYVIYSREIWFL